MSLASFFHFPVFFFSIAPQINMKRPLSSQNPQRNKSWVNFPNVRDLVPDYKVSLYKFPNTNKLIEWLEFS